MTDLKAPDHSASGSRPLGNSGGAKRWFPFPAGTSRRLRSYPIFI